MFCSGCSDEGKRPGDGEDGKKPGRKPGDGGKKPGEGGKEPGRKPGDGGRKPGEGDGGKKPGRKPGDGGRKPGEGDGGKEPGRKPGDGEKEPALDEQEADELSELVQFETDFQQKPDPSAGVYCKWCAKLKVFCQKGKQWACARVEDICSGCSDEGKKPGDGEDGKKPGQPGDGKKPGRKPGD